MVEEIQEPIAYSNCSSLSGYDLRLLALTRGVTALLCFLICITAILLLLKKDTLSRLLKTAEGRLMAYLILSTAAYLMVLTLHMEHYWNGKEERRKVRVWDNFCVGLGMSEQYTGSVQLYFIAGVAMHFIHQSLKLFSTQKYRKFWQAGGRVAKVGPELGLVLFSLLFPALYVWVPFVAVPYGETGPWCWIRTLGRDCQQLKSAFWEQMGIWYFPFGVAVSACLVSISMFLAALCYRLPKLKTKGQKKGEAILLIITLLSYCIVFLIEITCRVIESKTEEDNFLAWLFYAISTPLDRVILPIGLLVFTHTGTLREAAKYYCRCHKIRDTRLFITLFRDPQSFTYASTYNSSSNLSSALIEERDTTLPENTPLLQFS